MKKKTKDTKFEKIIIWILVALFILVGFLGIYIKKLNKLTNIIPEYNYGMDIKGNREFNLIIDNEEIEKKVYVDSQGNIVGDVLNEEQKIDGYNIETKTLKANNEKDLTLDNYKNTQKIIEKRIKNLQIAEYNLKLDNQTGKMVIELPQNDNTDKNYSILISEGNFEVLDKQTGIILMNNEDVKSANPIVNQSATGANEVYLQVQFTKEGAEKLKNISNKYIEYTEEGQENSKIDYITIELDGSTLYTTYFAEEWTSDYIYIPMTGEIKEESELKEAYNSIENIASIINTGKLPVKYTLESDKFIKSVVEEKDIQIFEIIVFSIIVVITIILAIKYKLKGLKLGILNIGFIALYSIVIRCLKVEINIPGIVSIIVIIIINLMLYYDMLKNKIKYNRLSEKIKEFNMAIIPIMIIAIVFTLTNNINTLSIGMLMFWGIILIEMYNLLIVRNIWKD